MRVILELNVDETTGAEFESLAPETKTQFIDTVHKMLQKTTKNLRIKKLRKLIEEMRQESGGAELDPEVLYLIMHNEEQ